MVSWIYSDPYIAVLETGVTLSDQKCARSGKPARMGLEPPRWLRIMILCPIRSLAAVCWSSGIVYDL